jgi:hypothetical protein
MRKNIASNNTEVASKNRRGRRALVPLATLAAAGALAVGSGANFVSQSVNPASAVASGTLLQSNSKANAAIFNVNNIKPGDTVNGDVTITNTGTLPEVMTLTETGTNGFTDKTNLVLTVTQGSTTVYSGAFAAMGAKSLGTFNPAEARTYRFSVTLKSTAGNAEQGKSASATYTWDGAQTAAVTTNSAATDATTATTVNANPNV